MKHLFWAALVVFVLALLLKPVVSVSKEGFVSYVVYGPGWGRGFRPELDYAAGPWWWYHRPYWNRRWRLLNGPCPGPWCPYR